jgi:hypothetical protein
MLSREFRGAYGSLAVLHPNFHSDEIGGWDGSKVKVLIAHQPWRQADSAKQTGRLVDIANIVNSLAPSSFSDTWYNTRPSPGISTALLRACDFCH